jgi:nitroreductase
MAQSKGLWEVVHSRRTFRALQPAAIDDATIERILEIARWAPSPFNAQPWHFMVVRERLAGLWDAIEAAGRAARAAHGGEPADKFSERVNWCRQSTVAILLYYDQQSVEEVVKSRRYLPRRRMEEWAEQSIGMAQLLITLAVTEAGLVAALQNFEDEERVIARFLQMPYPRFRLIRVMPIGTPAREVDLPARHPLTQITTFERWTAPADAQGEDLDAC